MPTQRAALHSAWFMPTRLWDGCGGVHWFWPGGSGGGGCYRVACRAGRFGPSREKGLSLT
ncbi:hypothetical protein HNP84_006797 [Thermocatellispora tengchongensis]|uniref:Uncharacterized protein n=1 Tax=Thermocatellispora tengchongensis TaxID=1073253 RepID=A0A840PLX6_9ACTN|nr:hypothetical protein [Thermocatellispora tengchongensis]